MVQEKNNIDVDAKKLEKKSSFCLKQDKDYAICTRCKFWCVFVSGCPCRWVAGKRKVIPLP